MSLDIDDLANALTILFEGSPTLYTRLVPELTTTHVSTYTDLIDAALSALSRWDNASKAAFIAGHPRIGESKNLSALSTKEQASLATPPEVLARLEHLNACYERRYPGLRYITFVNGRSRAAVKDEMEDVLGFGKSSSVSEPDIESIVPLVVGGEEWTSELERAVGDVGRIAKSRLLALGVV